MSYGWREKNVFINKRPDIPAHMLEVPTCQWCGVKRTRHFDKQFVRTVQHDDESTIVAEYEYTGRVGWQRGWYGYDRFCSLRCAEDFATAAHRAGFRRKEQRK
jgi:hypothetical protein